MTACSMPSFSSSSSSPNAQQHLFILTGASRGMGAAMAAQLLRPGHTLVTLSRTPTPLPACAGAVHLDWPSDFSSPQAPAQALETWLAQAQPYASATLINNAASIPPIAPLYATPAQDISHTLRVGLEAPMLLASAFLRSTRHWAVPKKLLNISSGLGRRGMASQAPYCAIKAGLDNFSQALALEEATLPHGARVCSLAPGVIDTAMQVQLRSADPAHFADAPRFAQLHAQGQLSSPADAAHQVLAWLARPDFGLQVIADVRQP